MELHRIALRALFIYVVLLGLVRLSGKRTVAEATSFAFVLALILGDVVDDGLWAEVPMAQFVAAAGTLTLTHIFVDWLSARSDWFDRLVSGVPGAVIAGGRPQRGAMRAERMNEKGLAMEIRHHGMEPDRWVEVEYARVEDNGAVSVLREKWARPARHGDAAEVRKAREP